MIDYYQVLQITRSADTAQIKAAYKRLAKRYHPDRNPGDILAEEKFKEINEAYHVLTDPIKKSRYDEKFVTLEISSTDPRREVQRRRYYSMRHAMQPVYRIDREYFRVQGLTFLVFAVIAGFCLALFHTATYFWDYHHHQRQTATSEEISKARAMFLQGDFEEAITLIDTLQKHDPHEFRFILTRDSLLQVLRYAADEKFEARNYAAAIVNYKVLEKKESPVTTETLHRIAFCQYYLGNYREALVAMKHLHHQNPNDLVLLYNIGIINLDFLEDPQDAILYFNLGERKFRENLSSLYGGNFSSLLKPDDVPDVYYDIFIGKARTSLQLKDYDGARDACNWATHLRSSEGEPFTLRAISNIKSGKFDLVCGDLLEGKRLLYPGVDSLIQQYCRQ